MSQPPNILFVFADQLRYDSLGCNGNRIVRTPHLDALAAEGVCFDQAFSSCPVCAPYRGTVLTGNYPHVNGVVDNEYRLFDDQRTLAHRLGEAGYRTAYIGKSHLGGGPYTPNCRYGFDDMIANHCTHHYYQVSYYRNEQGPIRIDGYAPFEETRLALDWIRDHRDRCGDQPFAAVLGWGPPHWTGAGGDNCYDQYPDEYRIYDPGKMELADNVPVQFRGFAAREMADYYGMVTSLDDYMGRLLAGLDEMGLADDTIVCFSSDHGDHLSAHGYGKPRDSWMHHTLRASKITPHNESVRIPFILRWPGGSPACRRTDVMFNSVDVMPTLLSLAGLGGCNNVQGRDLSHAVSGGAGENPDSVYLQILGPGWPARAKLTGLWRAVRTPTHLYARWHDCGGKRMLFDIQDDPLEMHDLIDDPESAAIAEQMEARLQQWIAETNDPFDTGERVGETEMLNLGQATTSQWAHDSLPEEYRRVIAPNYANFKTGQPVEGI